MRRFAEGFFTMKNPRKSLLCCLDAKHHQHLTVSDAVRKSDYFQSLPNLEVYCKVTVGERLEILYDLKVLSHEFFGGRRSSIGSRLFALLLGTFLLSTALRFSRLLLLWSPRLTGPLSRRFFRAPRDPRCKVKFAERTGELR